MKRTTRVAASALLVLALAQSLCWAQDNKDDDKGATPPIPTALDAELFYQLLLGELNARSSEPAAGFSLILDAARKTNDPALYQRAVDIAFQGRSGESALQAARAWKQAHPASREANRYVLQILVAMNRINDSIEPLRTDLTLAQTGERNAALAALPRIYSRVSDKKLAAAAVERALADRLTDRATGVAAWTTVGRLRLAAADTGGALEAARQAQSLNPAAEGPALLGLELMDPKQPVAETIVKKYLEAAKPLPELRMGYARALLDALRYAEASRQLEQVTADKPDYAEAWLVRGTLQVQDNQLDAAETSLKRFVDLAQGQSGNEERARGLAQAYLALSQIAERRKDFAQAGAWLDKIENAQDLVTTQNRRASILARQGKLDEALKLLQALPERNPAQARVKLMAQVQLLRDHKRYKSAYDLLTQAAAAQPTDTDLLYDLAMLAEKIGDMDDMERLLRRVIAAKPDFHHAYNALGYSFADRNIRLQEGKQLIQKALEFAPGDPFISDSLGWVEFRMGNKEEALRILDTAYKARPDPEIAAHLGEVLWSMGQRARALAIWKEALEQGADNETLQETLKRLRVKP